MCFLWKFKSAQWSQHHTGWGNSNWENGCHATEDYLGNLTFELDWRNTYFAVDKDMVRVFSNSLPYFLLLSFVLYLLCKTEFLEGRYQIVCIFRTPKEAHDSNVRRVYAPRFFVSSQQRFGVMDIKAPSAGHSSRVLDRPCYSSQVSNGPCYSS